MRKLMFQVFGVMSIMAFAALFMACASPPPPPEPAPTPARPAPPPPPPRSQLVSDERINVNWADSSDDIYFNHAREILRANFRRYRYYHVWFATHDNSATNSWVNAVHFQEFTNPQQTRVRLVFNFFQINFEFSNSQLRMMDGTLFRRTALSRNFNYDVREVVSRASLQMRGMTFGNRTRHEVDLIWLEWLSRNFTIGHIVYVPSL